MTGRLEIRMPRFPECWDTCGSCASGEVVVQSLLVRAGETLEVDDTILVVETGKVALDIPSPKAGRVLAIHVDEGQPLAEGQLLLTLDPA